MHHEKIGAKVLEFADYIELAIQERKRKQPTFNQKFKVPVC